MTRLSNPEISKIANYLGKKLSVQDMKSVLFDVGHNYDDLRGESRTGKFLEAVDWASRHAKVDEFFQACVNKNHTIDFSQFNLHYEPEDVLGEVELSPDEQEKLELIEKLTEAEKGGRVNHTLLAETLLYLVKKS